MNRSRTSYSPRERHLYGATATLVDPVDGHQRTIAYTEMSVREAARLIAAAADRYGMLVRSISHPLSILGDLDGRFTNAHGRIRQRGKSSPESVILGGIGRTDLIEWKPASRDGLKRRRKAEGVDR